MKVLKMTPGTPLVRVLGDYKGILVSVGCFTALINLLMLVPSIYMLQVYDRVLTSQNETTLVMLTLMVVGFFAFIGLLETIRSFIVIRIGSALERRFNLKPHLMNYIIVSEKSADEVVSEINSILEDYNKEMHGVRLSRNNGKERVVFSVEGTHSEHKAIAGKFRLSDDLKSFETVQGAEIE